MLNTYFLYIRDTVLYGYACMILYILSLCREGSKVTLAGYHGDIVQMLGMETNIDRAKMAEVSKIITEK